MNAMINYSVWIKEDFVPPADRKTASKTLIEKEDKGGRKTQEKPPSRVLGETLGKGRKENYDPNEGGRLR